MITLHVLQSNHEVSYHVQGHAMQCSWYRGKKELEVERTKEGGDRDVLAQGTFVVVSDIAHPANLIIS